VEFIQQALEDPAGIEWHFALSSTNAAELNRFVKLPESAEVFEKSPARDRPTRRRLSEYVDRHPAAAVLTLFGPAYVRFKIPHILTVGDGWLTHPTWLAYRTLSGPREWLSIAAMTVYKTRWLRRADYWCSESEAGRQGLHRRVGVPLERISVIPNTCGERYRETSVGVEQWVPGKKLRILTFAAPYSHKNLTILPNVAAALQQIEPNLDFEIVVTLPESSNVWHSIQRGAQRQGTTNRIVNRGPVAVADGPELYRSCHICLLPTVLETFSATYPESMAMGLPIVTSDLNFAHDVCRDAALYFHPRDPTAAAKHVQKLVHDPSLWVQLTGRGREILAELPTPRQRYLMYVNALRGWVGGAQ
jgi:glycosyltransferase involved in cell wall biosynthesis